MSQPQDPTNNIYMQYHQSTSTANQAFEWQHTQILQLREAIKIREAKIDELNKKLNDLQPNLKKK